MKICLIGKYPPIEGGVSTRTYAFAHSLARQGHEVHMVTNANDVRAPYRMFMREEDWQKCDADYGEGSVTAHWTDRAGAGQFHIPMSPSYVTKLASLAIEVCERHGIDVILGFYMEPYGIAAYLASKASGTPYVLKTAGSDAGRLWQQRQFKPLFDHVFRQARRIIAGGALRDALVDMGVPRTNIWPDPSYTVPEDLFTPEGDALDIANFMSAAKADRQFAPLVFGDYDPSLDYIGVYGKLGEKKGTFALLEAMRILLDQGMEAGLMVVGQERPRSTRKFRDAVHELELEDYVVQLPFLPNWRVPAFIRRCSAICCLEQDFPIKAHAPIAPREVLVAGGCLIASFEMLQKLPGSRRLIDGYNCIGLENVFDVPSLAGAIERVVSAPKAARAVGARGRAYATREQAAMPFPDRLASILAGAMEERPPSGGTRTNEPIASPGPSWAARATAAFSVPEGEVCPTDTAAICDLLEARFAQGDNKAGLFLDMLRLEEAFRARLAAHDTADRPFTESFTRLANDILLADDADIGGMIATPIEPVSFVPLNFDGNSLLGALNGPNLPELSTPTPNAVAIKPDQDGVLQALVLGTAATEIFKLSDGTRKVNDILNQRPDRHSRREASGGSVATVLGLLENGLIRLTRA